LEPCWFLLTKKETMKCLAALIPSTLAIDLAYSGLGEAKAMGIRLVGPWAK